MGEKKSIDMMTMELITKFVKFMAQALVSFVRWDQNSNIVKFKKKNTHTKKTHFEYVHEAL